jgi:opacity protein-like surface antigen
MRQLFIAAVILAVCAVSGVASAQDGNNEVQGFGGLTFGSPAIGSSTSSTFGGRVAVGLGDNIQIIGEGGRMTDIKSPLLDLLDFTPVGVQLSAWYGEAGVRLIASPHNAVRPYGEATAGFAKLSPSLNGVGGRTGAIIDTSLNVLDRTEPLLGAGAGVVLQGGPVSLDLGYRYKKIMAGNSVASVLNGGQDFSVNQFRIGVGVRF